jgi:hypothetical protein
VSLKNIRSEFDRDYVCYTPPIFLPKKWLSTQVPLDPIDDTYYKSVNENIDIETQLDYAIVNIFCLFGEEGEELIDMVIPEGSGPNKTPTPPLVYFDHSDII